MPELSRQVISLFQKRAASEPGGLLTGKDPTEFNPTEPIRLWIVQLGVIILTATLLSLALRKLRQPKVIAEVLGGIILGPTALGRIPGFTEHIFPADSRPYLSLTANIGLCLFLFLVGLEIDGNVIKRNLRLSAMVALAGMVIPFGMGAGIAVPIYNRFIDQSVEFTHFMLFTGVAFSITAFPVLCRILTELKLLDTTVGIVVLSAGVGNDIIGWVLLALSVALVNAGSGLTALYILLVSVGWTLFVLFPVKYAMKWLARVTGAFESGPSPFYMTVTILVLFGSAFFTDIIGVHAIFGAFLAGLVVPREGGLAITLTEKLEDFVAIIFLPLYFTLSGLSTDLGLLDDGITWAFTIAVIVMAFVGKFGGCSVAARYAAGFSWREATTIGSLMSCKGLVELIVLNVGLSAGILSRRVFSMFVLEALVLTFATTPLVEWLYPPKFRVRIAATGANFKNVADGENAPNEKRPVSRDSQSRTRFTVVLDKFEHLGGLMALVQLLAPAQPIPEYDENIKKRPSASSVRDLGRNPPQVNIDALRLIELSDRVSGVMKSSKADAVLQSDPLMAAFRMFSVLNNINTSPALSIVKFDDLAYSITEHARNCGSDMILVPWSPFTKHGLAVPDGAGGEPGANAIASQSQQPTATTKAPNNPFEFLFRSALGDNQNLPQSAVQSQLIRGVFSQATTDVALFVDQSMVNTDPSTCHHLFLPFYGGPDDRLALEMVVQLCENPRISATVVRISRRVEDVEVSPTANVAAEIASLSSEIPGEYPDTYYGALSTQTKLQSETADNITWAKFAGGASNAGNVEDDAKSSRSRASNMNSRLTFKEISTQVPLSTALQEAIKHSDVTPAHHHRRSESDGKDNLAGGGGDGDIVDESPSLGRERKSSHDCNLSIDERLPRRSKHRGPLIIVTGRSRRLAAESHRQELGELMQTYGDVGAEVRKAIGDVATAFCCAGVGAAVVVLQAFTGVTVD
ncbi:hypothetical protein FA15DRAFT_251347 [Coprinopsis marcescibilis]|uniref:Cation/H+ exchanger transmembrane domain-containing protein n=1 Tax=Coprinopsis marcescibilis TaxID=230819 RepID=A0A5C3L3Y8_COPMA|nr:hypothetical protein FA15DRAFT_251347 [Coprinopsis marcescibilis]